MNIAYFGSPDISRSLLDLLFDLPSSHNISLVVTQPDKPVGKHLELTPTPVKVLALQKSLLIFDKNIKETMHEDNLISLLRSESIDLCILFAYGAIISEKVLQTPQYGFWNIHPSKLPYYRGPSPIAYPVMLGEDLSEVTLMKMSFKLDSGPIISAYPFSIRPTALRPEIEKEIAPIANTLISEALCRLPDLKMTEQDHSKATYTHLLKKAHGYIPFDILLKAREPIPMQRAAFPEIVKVFTDRYSIIPKQMTLGQLFFDIFRALYPWPGMWSFVSINGQQKRIKINSLQITPQGGIHIKNVQIEGKQEIPFSDFIKSYNIESEF